MKRMVSALLAFVLLFGLVGCQTDSEDRLEASQEETVQESETEELPEETAEETEEETFEETEEETVELTQPLVTPCQTHTWGEWVRWEKATSTTQGKRVRTCTVCGEEDVEIEPTLPKTNHTHKYKVEKSAATCLEDGWAYYYCTCGDWYQVTLKATGHSWGSWEFITIPTEDTKGTKIRICGNCKEREEEETPTLREHSHKFYDFRNEPTCTKAGSKGQICSVCGYAKSTKINALGHKYGSWEVTKKATEKEKGVKTRTCKRCKHQETKYIDKLPHTTHKWKDVKTVPPTCTEEGYTEQKCTVCSATQKSAITAATGHLHTEEKQTKAPTCTEAGLWEQVCKDCGASVGSREADALGHDWSGGICSRCGASEPTETPETTEETEGSEAAEMSESPEEPESEEE